MSRTRGLKGLPAGLAALAALVPLALAVDAATLSVTVLRHDGRPLAGAVVMVHSLDGAAKPSPPVRAVMDQVNQMFTPDLLVIPVGSTVEFPNSDTTRHEVYSFSPAHPFQLPLYRGKPYPDFDTCRIHGRDFSRQNRHIRPRAERAVYLGAQASFKSGGGLGIFKDFKRLRAAEEGSVTCQTVPFGLDN